MTNKLLKNSAVFVAITVVFVGILTLLNAVLWVPPVDFDWDWLAKAVAAPADVKTAKANPADYVTVPAKMAVGTAHTNKDITWAFEARGDENFAWPAGNYTGVADADLPFAWDYENVGAYKIIRVLYDYTGTPTAPIGTNMYIVASSAGRGGEDCIVTIAIDTEQNFIEGIHLFTEAVQNNFFGMEAQYRINETYQNVVNESGLVAFKEGGAGIISYELKTGGNRPTVTGGSSSNPTITIKANTTMTNRGFFNALNGTLAAYRGALLDPHEIAAKAFLEISALNDDYKIAEADLPAITSADIAEGGFAETQIITSVVVGSYTYFLVNVIGQDANSNFDNWGGTSLRAVVVVQGKTLKAILAGEGVGGNSSFSLSTGYAPDADLAKFNTLIGAGLDLTGKANPFTGTGNFKGTAGELAISSPSGATTSVNQIAFALNLVATEVNK